MTSEVPAGLSPRTSPESSSWPPEGSAEASASAAPSAAQAFAELARIVAQWRGLDRVTTTAGLKPALQQSLGSGFSERRFGFETFRDFAAAAEREGYVRIHRMPNGHNLLVLPDEDPVAVERLLAPYSAAPSSGHPLGYRDPVSAPTTGTPTAGRSEVAAGHTRRLTGDVWHAVVDWSEGCERLWDRTRRRAFLYPVSQGRPAWEVNPEHFVGLPALGQDVQIPWMREWAALQPESVRGRLQRSLADNAPRGAFRRELTALNLTGEWRSELQRRVLGVVLEWCAAHDVRPDEVIDHRPVPVAVAVTAPSPGVTAGAGDAVHRSPLPRTAVPAAAAPEIPPSAGSPTSELEQLRARIHRVIDRMSLAELAGLPIRAEHLLADL